MQQASVANLQTVVARIESRARTRRLLAYLRVALGVMAMFFGPIFMSPLIWYVMAVFWKWLPWWPLFWTVAGVLIPLQFWTEWRSRGNYLSDALAGKGPADDAGYWMARTVAVETGMGSRTAFAAFELAARPQGLIELMLWGPRQVLGGMSTIKMIRGLSVVDPLRAGEMLVGLLSQSRGMPLQKVMKKGERKEAALCVLAYLVFFEWAGASEKSETAWARTESREELKG